MNYVPPHTFFFFLFVDAIALWWLILLSQVLGGGKDRRTRFWALNSASIRESNSNFLSGGGGWHACVSRWCVILVLLFICVFVDFIFFVFFFRQSCLRLFFPCYVFGLHLVLKAGVSRRRAVIDARVSMHPLQRRPCFCQSVAPRSCWRCQQPSF